MDLFPGQTFSWDACVDLLDAFEESYATVRGPDGRSWCGGGWRIWPPLVFPVAPDCIRLADYVDALPDAPGAHLVILLQAGAASLGRFAGGEEVATKSLKKYVVRGSGRAQPTHLETKGKSRYGSRLRLQNARRLLQEVNERLCAWDDELGPVELVFHASVPRLWADLLATRPAPPFVSMRKDDSDAEVEGARRSATPPLFVHIPRDVERPTTEVLRRVYRSLTHGRVEADAAPPG